MSVSVSKVVEGDSGGTPCDMPLAVRKEGDCLAVGGRWGEASPCQAWCIESKPISRSASEAILRSIDPERPVNRLLVPRVRAIMFPSES
jgi:hypothetical protein